MEIRSLGFRHRGTNYHIRLDPDTARALDLVASRLGVTRSDLMRRYVGEFEGEGYGVVAAVRRGVVRDLTRLLLAREREDAGDRVA